MPAGPAPMTTTSITVSLQKAALFALEEKFISSVLAIPLVELLVHVAYCLRPFKNCLPVLSDSYRYRRTVG